MCGCVRMRKELSEKRQEINLFFFLIIMARFFWSVVSFLSLVIPFPPAPSNAPRSEQTLLSNAALVRREKREEEHRERGREGERGVIDKVVIDK